MMFDKMVRRFVKNADNVNDPVVRESYGRLSGVTGIILNYILCAAKIVVGALTGAISVLSDGVNNLSDAGSSVITLIGFKMSAKKPDKGHPFGHGRTEYFAGLAVSAVILIVAVQLLIGSVKKIVAGEATVYSSEATFFVTIGVLVFSIFVKGWMAVFNRDLGKRLNSAAMKATAADSLSDCVATAVVLLCAVLSRFFESVPIDGYAGVAVSLFIAFAGIQSMRSVVDLLMGEAPDPEFCKEVADYALHFNELVIGVHDLVVHDYGPGRKMITLHVEVPAEGDILQMHDVIDNIEHGIEQKFNCKTTIHMDPVITTSKRLSELKKKCVEIVSEIRPEFTLHDFRMNEGDTHTNLIFDVVVPYDTKLTPHEIEDQIDAALKKTDPKLRAKINVDYK